MDDVIPFLETFWRAVTSCANDCSKLLNITELFGGVSPINEQNRKLISALHQELENNGPHLPIYLATATGHPLLLDTMRQMRDDAVKRSLGFVTSAYDFLREFPAVFGKHLKAHESVGPARSPRRQAARVLQSPFVHPGERRADSSCTRPVFAEPQRSGSSYSFHGPQHSSSQWPRFASVRRSLRRRGALIAESLGIEKMAARISRAAVGQPAQPWLGPDVRDYLRELRGLGTRR